MQTTELRVDGMTCSGCVKSVSRVLEAVPGVTAAEVSLETGKARVTFDPVQVNVEALVAAIENAGYEAR